MDWKPAAWWFGMLVAALVLYGWWAERTRSLIGPHITKEKVVIDQGLADYVNRTLGAKSKTGCGGCNPEQERMLLGLKDWVETMHKRQILSSGSK